MIKQTGAGACGWLPIKSSDFMAHWTYECIFLIFNVHWILEFRKIFWPKIIDHRK